MKSIKEHTKNTRSTPSPSILQQIKEAADGQGLSMRQLAKKAELPKSTVQGIFKDGWGKQVRELQKLCDTLGLTLKIEKV